MSGAYPDYRGVIPAVVESTARLPIAPLVAQLRALAAIARDDVHRVGLQLTDGAVAISALTKEVGTGKIRATAQRSGPAAQLKMNLQFLIEVLDVLACDQVELGISSSASRLVVRPGSEAPYVYVALPITL